MSKGNEIIAGACSKYFAGRQVGAPWHNVEDLASAVARQDLYASGVFLQFVEDSLMLGASTLDKLAPKLRPKAVEETLNFDAWANANPTIRDIVSNAPDFRTFYWEIDKRVKARNLAETGGELRVSPEESLRMSYRHFDRLVANMSPSIREGRWSSILVEGVSGKPVADVLSEVMRLHAVDSGKPVPFKEYLATRGVGNLRPAYLSNLSFRIDDLQPQLGPSRVLVVTEAIAGGSSIRPVLQNLEKRGLQYDVASLYNGRRDIKNRLIYDNSDFDRTPSKWKPSGYDAFGGMRRGMAKSEDQTLQAKNRPGLREVIGIDVDKSGCDSARCFRTEITIPDSKLDLYRSRVSRFDAEIKRIAEELYAKHFK